MQRNRWAENQASTYRDAAQHLRRAAARQDDTAITRHLEEIAERYEKLSNLLATFSTTSSAA